MYLKSYNCQYINKLNYLCIYMHNNRYSDKTINYNYLHNNTPIKFNILALILQYYKVYFASEKLNQVVTTLRVYLLCDKLPIQMMHP